MNSFLQFYQHIPEHINPEIFHVGFFSVGWYSVMYLVAFFVVLRLLEMRLRLDEGENIFGNTFNEKGKDKLEKQKGFILDFMYVCFLGVVIGGRLGYVLFYNLSFYFAHPLAIISPFDLATGGLVGIYGMSYHGGLIGALLATLFFVRFRKLNFWALSDFVVPAIPAGYLLGRIGNFLNGELYGRVTDMWVGMYFPSDVLGVLRHPSQLYEAFLEGFLLFWLFWKIRNKKVVQGRLLGLYLMGYAVARFIGEFFREPDEQVGLFLGYFTLGQLFSFAMLVGGLVLVFCERKKCAILKQC
ncbi:MAG: prolipoprotein diacylglyceryl transferase [Candidatus Moraniibacteriota bacterium]|jgi:phosphatidylglycerol:prolipoprotein diacylglycerol transferase